MVRIAAVAEQRPQQLAIAGHDVDLAVQRRAQPGAQVRRRREGLAAHGLVPRLDVVVVGRDDGLLAGEVVIGGAEGHAGRRRDVTHGGLLEAALPQQRQRRLEDVAAGALAVGSLRSGPGRGVFEHVQSIRPVCLVCQ